MEQQAEAAGGVCGAASEGAVAIADCGLRIVECGMRNAECGFKGTQRRGEGNEAQRGVKCGIGGWDLGEGEF